MKKYVALLFAASIAVQCLTAQVAEGIKLLNYEKNKSAKELLQKNYDASYHGICPNSQTARICTQSVADGSSRTRETARRAEILSARQRQNALMRNYE